MIGDFLFFIFQLCKVKKLENLSLKNGKILVQFTLEKHNCPKFSPKKISKLQKFPGISIIYLFIYFYLFIYDGPN
jgi:hypothetical protein